LLYLPYGEVVADQKAGGGQFGTSPAWRGFISNVSSNQFNDFTNMLHQSYRQQHSSSNGFNKAIYGTNGDGSTHISQEMDNTLKEKANQNAMGTLKALWALENSGADPTELSYMINPFERAQYLSTLALTISSDGEALDIMQEVSIDVILSNYGRLGYLKNSNGLSFKFLRGKGGEINGFSISNGPGYGAKPRFDWHPISHPSRKSYNLTHKGNLPHYHRGKGNDLHIHRPWEKDAKGKRRF
jgi:hypothetical protein